MAGAQAGALGRAVPFALVLLSVAGFQRGAALAKPLFAIVGAQGASALRLRLVAAKPVTLIGPWRVPLSGSLLLGKHLTTLQGVAIAPIMAASAGTTLTNKPLLVPQ